MLGAVTEKEVPEKMVAAIAMSGNLYDVLTHPCLVVGMDKGPVTRGGGKGVKGAMRRDAFFGRDLSMSAHSFIFAAMR